MTMTICSLNIGVDTAVKHARNAPTVSGVAACVFMDRSRSVRIHGLETRRELEPKAGAAVDWPRSLSVHPLTPQEQCRCSAAEPGDKACGKSSITFLGVNNTSIPRVAAKIGVLLQLRPLTS